MHQVSYSFEELITLRNRLLKLDRHKGLWERRDSLLGLIEEIITAADHSPVMHDYAASWVMPTDFHAGPYKPFEAETVYKLLKYQLTVKHPKAKKLQHPIQVIYHLPYVQLPPLMGHKSKLIQTIVGWRLELGK